MSFVKTVCFYIAANFLLSLIVVKGGDFTKGKVVFSRINAATGIEQIYRVNIDGSGLEQLTFDTLIFNNYLPRWSKDGKKIAFAKSWMFHQSQIMIMDSDGSNIKGISNPWGSEAEDLSWSSDGSKLVFSGGGIWITSTSSLNGSTDTLIYSYGYNPQWSNDDKKIYFNSGYLADSLGVSRGNLFSIDIKTGHIEQFTTNAIDAEAYGHLSPDETRIVFSMGPYQTGRRIYLTDLYLSYIDTLTDGPNDDYPRWSNCGTKIVFVRDEDTSYGSSLYAVYVMNPDGTDLQRVTQPIRGPYEGDFFPDLFIDTSAVGITAPQENANPQTFSLEQNCPNPFNSSTVIRYSLSRQAEVSLTIHNLLGSEIKRLVHGIKSPGIYSIVWDSKDSKGNQVPSGIYLYRLQVGSFSVARKLVLMR